MKLLLVGILLTLMVGMGMGRGIDILNQENKTYIINRTVNYTETDSLAYNGTLALNSSLNNHVLKSGDTMTGPLNMSTNADIEIKEQILWKTESNVSQITADSNGYYDQINLERILNLDVYAQVYSTFWNQQTLNLYQDTTAINLFTDNQQVKTIAGESANVILLYYSFLSQPVIEASAGDINMVDFASFKQAPSIVGSTGTVGISNVYGTHFQPTFSGNYNVDRVVGAYYQLPPTSATDIGVHTTAEDIGFWSENGNNTFAVTQNYNTAVKITSVGDAPTGNAIEIWNFTQVDYPSFFVDFSGNMNTSGYINTTGNVTSLTDFCVIAEGGGCLANIDDLYYNKTQIDELIPSILTYYFWDAVSPTNASYKVMNITTNTVRTNHTANALSNGQVIVWRINDNTNLTGLDGGSLHLHTTATKLNGTQNIAIVGKLSKYLENGTIVLLGTTDTSPVLITGAPTNINLFSNIPRQALNVTDRLLWRLEAVVTGAGTAPSVNITVGGDTGNGIDLPVQVSNIILNEVDPKWSANYTAYNSSWSNTYNSTENVSITNYIKSVSYVNGWTNLTRLNQTSNNTNVVLLGGAGAILKGNVLHSIECNIVWVSNATNGTYAIWQGFGSTIWDNVTATTSQGALTNYTTLIYGNIQHNADMNITPYFRSGVVGKSVFVTTSWCKYTPII